MRILFWNAAYLPHLGGVQVFTARLAAGLTARGHQVGVVASRHPASAPEEEVLDGVTVFRPAFAEALLHPDPMSRIRLMKAATLEAAAIKRQFAPDLVHLNLADANPIFHLRSQHETAVPTVLTVQSALLKPSIAAGNLTAALMEMASRIVGVSRFAAGNIVRFTRAPLAAVDVIFPGVPAEEFSLGPPPQGPPTIVFLGRLVEEKGADTAIAALAHLPADTRLVLIGEGPLRADLEALAVRLGLRDRVTFAGRVNDATRARLLSEATVMAAPSRHEELFGMIAVEGALCGLPVVASAIGGLQEIVVPGQTGDLAAPGDPASLARALAPFVSDPNLARRTGLAGRERALSLFSMDQTVTAYEQLYRECLADPTRRALPSQAAPVA